MLAPLMHARTLALLPFVLLACGKPATPAERKAPRKLEDETELEVHRKDEAEREAKKSESPGTKTLQRQPAWQRQPPQMPERFAAFAQPDLAALEGFWIVASDIEGQRELWIVEDQGHKVTIVDARGNERLHGLALLSPCSVQVTNEYGRTRARSFAWVGETLFLHAKGGVALAGPDDELIACIGSQTITVGADGKCTAFSELLGVWREDAEPCERIPAGEQPARLELAERELIAGEGGVWLDATSSANPAQRFADRASAEAALASAPTPADPSTATPTAPPAPTP